jgi:uncharacterized delta-60 repeat protein
MIRFAAEHLEPRRLMAAGDLDPSFGGVGAMDVDLFHPLFGVQRVVPIPGGDFLVIGQEIRRYKPNGTLDPSFGGGDGIMTLPDARVAANEYLENAAVLPDGKVIAVIRRVDGATTLHSILGFNADGSPSDKQLPVGGLGEIDQFVVQADGKVLAVGASQVMRFMPDFEPDLTFGLNGVTRPLLSSSAMDVASDGSIFDVGLNQDTPPKKVIVKFTAEGVPDTSFGSNGQVVTADQTSTPITELEAEAGGTLLVVDDNGNIRRLKPDGAYDSSFGDNGIANPTFGDIAPATPELTLVQGGKILVVKGTGITRLNSDGSIDPAYGRVVADLSGIGIPAANQWGEVYFTSAGITRTLALHRLAADSALPAPIRLESGQLFCIGTDNADEMHASDQNGDLVIMRNRFDVSRVFEPADVTLLNFQGLGGNDFITLASAGSIRSTVSGGDGNDKILGGPGADSIGGNAGKDFIAGGSGADRLAGHGGRDKLLGEGGADRCYGGPSGDWLLGAGGNDQLFGDGGNDQLFGGSGNDSLDAGQGDDLLISNDAAIEPPGWVDSLWGDGGKDRSIADPIDILSSIETKLDALGNVIG